MLILTKSLASDRAYRNLFSIAFTWVSVTCSLSCLAWGQLPAFPGAEGAAQFITGGRGGDVYKVTNLNDSGAGSLRHGIQTAPGTGRTIVFDVAGTIVLNSSLDFNGKSNLTIAGQTAPGGGITLYGNPSINKHNARIRINDADNVIVQFLRSRPGAASDDADGLWVQNSTNVMIDHVTTAWSTDESLSTTHNSNNVTVQWSTMFQGILGHSFGSLINGGNYTYHHNLYAHNRSRNPRPQDSGNFLTLDFVNNVIYNPGDRFGYGGGPYHMNMVGNYGIKGPNSQNSEPANYLMRPSGSGAEFFVEGNYIDIVRDGEVNGVLVEGHDAFRPGDSYTLVGTRFDAGGALPPVQTHTADQAYVHVLSRAGAVNFRDAHDRDMIRSIFNQQPGHISHENEWGANPSLPAGTPKVDTSGDGVPDEWAIAKGFDVNTQLHQVVAPSGYTYLEEYIHSLTPFAYAPTNTSQHTIRTSYGMGADAQVNENSGTSSGAGLAGTIDTRWAGPSGNTNQAMLLRFDLSQIQPGSVDSARLELTTAAPITGVHQFKVYGLEHDAAGWDWDEATVEFATAPGLEFDGNSGTLGIDPRYTANGQLATTNNHPLPAPEDLLNLGTFSLGSTAAGETVGFESLNLAVFLNLAAFFEGDDMAGMATIIIQQINNTGSAASFISKEGDPLLAPSLVVEATVTALPDNADLDGDGYVDGHDFLLWQQQLGQAGGTTADGLATWESQFGTLPDPLSASVAVPEPASGLIMLIAGICVSVFRMRKN